MNRFKGIKPFERCPALDGYHCVTSSMARMYHHGGHPLSEDMLLGLGAGMGFIYWRMKMKNAGDYVLFGGRGNARDSEKWFYRDVGKRTGVHIDVVTTSSVKKAETSLLEELIKKRPMMLHGDMAFLPWFDLPPDYHFGEHAFVVCGFDGKSTVLASDIDQKSAGLKKGFYHAVSLEQLRKARGSEYKPFPPRNACVKFDFSGFHGPAKADVHSAVSQCAREQLYPPIKNMGVRGIRYAAQELPKWPGIFNDETLRNNLFNLYIFVEVGGTGGGCFRYMYSRFLKEAQAIAKNDRFNAVAEKFHESGRLFSRIGLLFKDEEIMDDIGQKINEASGLLLTIADIEETAFRELLAITKSSR